MQLRELEYQQRILDLLNEYLDELIQQKSKADKLEKMLAENSPEDPEATCFLNVPLLDFPLQTWQALGKKNRLPSSRVNISHSPRPDGIGRPVPNVVYKVPTAGGKTFLAVASLSKIFNKYLGKNTGFVLWIVPNEAIYTQTRKQLHDRRHPYRQLLDNISGGAVKVMEKNTSLNAADVESNLCVMLLMLQSSNRQNKETLKIFQERGDVYGFTPAEGDQQAHQQTQKAIPNLDTCTLADSSYPWMPIKDSLGNALRITRPVVVLDEGHKAVSDLAFKTLYGFNPCFVLELTATPKDVLPRTGGKPRASRYQNLLAEVSGIELDREGMIKMPLNLDARQNTDWQSTLASALERLHDLDEQAKKFHANKNRYIRPILLVQVERTGDDQRDGHYIHAEAVKDWLTGTGKLDAAEVAIKTSAKNDLKAPENQDLLSETSRIRVIITKQALQEGWDCSFAYVLCSLAASSSQSAMTQLIGRVLRQPHAEKTGIKALDECYVITHHADTSQVVQSIKQGLEQDGMGDLVQAIHIDNPSSASARNIRRNPKFLTDRVFLPKVLWISGNTKRDIDYEEDILYPLDWSSLHLDDFIQSIPKNGQASERQLHQITLDSSRSSTIKDALIGNPKENQTFDCAYAVQSISDIVSNAWVARDIIKQLITGLQHKGFTAGKLGKLSSLIIEKLRQWLSKQCNQMAEKRFHAKVRTGHIQFRLHTNSHDWEMPGSTITGQLENAPQLPRNDGQPLQRSLFLPVYQDDLNQAERNVAVYLDDVETLKWWHRNVARRQYALQGWQRHKIYPDFICKVNTEQGKSKLVVLEMKGEHLDGNADTEYKKAILKLMSDSFSIEQAPRIGEMQLMNADDISVQCDLVLMSDYTTKLPALLTAS